ncbi:MAG: hypothetical protein ACI85O_002705 [Saprospiraceae bacterium]|jgi:hypothetical protein
MCFLEGKRISIMAHVIEFLLLKQKISSVKSVDYLRSPTYFSKFEINQNEILNTVSSNSSLY